MSSKEIKSPWGPLAFLDDLWNPILVKEVRQSLRGRYFRISFVLVLIAVMVSSAAMIVSMGNGVSSNEGRDFFFGIYLCLSAAVLGLVPFAAFNSMGSEWEENTFDLLVISNLRPRKIMSGKLLSAWTQSMLYFSAFTPFLVFAFLLRGVDLLAVVVLLASAQILSLGLSILAIFLSTLSRQRFVRIVLLAILAALLTFAVSMTGVMAEGTLRYPGQLRDRDFWIGALASFSFFAAVASFCFLAGCNLLAHEEENRSTGLRVLSVIVLLTAMLFSSVALVLHPERDALSIISIAMILMAMVPGTFFCTEAERLGRRVAPRLPTGPVRSILSLPFLPGGSRGLLLFGLQLASIVLFSSVGHAVMSGGAGGPWNDDGSVGVIVAALYAFFFVAFPSGLLSRFTTGFKRRTLVRSSVPLLIMLFGFAPALLGFFVQSRDLMQGEHLGNPLFLIGESFRQRGPWMLTVTAGLALLAALALVINGPRLRRGLLEWRAARAECLRRAALLPPAGGSDANAAARS